MKNIVIIGASDYGSAILQCIQNEGKYHVVGFIDSYKRKSRKWDGFDILGTIHDLPYLTDKHQLFGGIIAIDANKERKKVAEKVVKLVSNFKFVVTIDPSVALGDDLYIGKGSVILKGARIESHSWVGDFCVVNTDATLGANGIMDDFSSLAMGVSTGGDFGLAKFTNIDQSIKDTDKSSVFASFDITDLGYHAMGFSKHLKTNL